MHQQRHWPFWVEHQLSYRPEYRIKETEKLAVEQKCSEIETSGEIDSDTDAATESENEIESETHTERNTEVDKLLGIKTSENLASTHDAIGEILNKQKRIGNFKFLVVFNKNNTKHTQFLAKARVFKRRKTTPKTWSR